MKIGLGVDCGQRMKGTECFNHNFVKCYEYFTNNSWTNYVEGFMIDLNAQVVKLSQRGLEFQKYLLFKFCLC